MKDDSSNLDIKQVASTILKTIDREREQEIIARRFGLYDRKETLEQIGEMLGITRERVRQLEKAILGKLKKSDKESALIASIEKELITNISAMGRIARVSDIAKKMGATGDDRDKAHIAFLATICPKLVVLQENDHYYPSVGIASYFNEKQIKTLVDSVVNAVKSFGKPITIDQLHGLVNFEHPDHVRALASLSKHLTHLKDEWGLIKWPTVNPKNIRDKIYVILKDTNEPLHFSEISKAIKNSDFKRRDVTTQAIHNELIKDPRFVLIGRGIYALKEWGYKKGTVSDIITNILQASENPMHKDDIVKEVMKKRQVKETTILLNLQGKKQFKRVAKATYIYQPENNVDTEAPVVDKAVAKS